MSQRNDCVVVAKLPMSGMELIAVLDHLHLDRFMDV